MPPVSHKPLPVSRLPRREVTSRTSRESDRTTPYIRRNRSSTSSLRRSRYRPADVSGPPSSRTPDLSPLIHLLVHSIRPAQTCGPDRRSVIELITTEPER